MIPQTATADSVKEFSYPTRTYRLDFEKKRVMGHTDGIGAVRQAVYKILRQERYGSLIYSWNYGVELSRFIGKDFDYIKAAFPGEIKEALYMDDRVINVGEFTITKQGLDSCLVSFVVESVFGGFGISEAINI
jgi:hypothetical protein